MKENKVIQPTCALIVYNDYLELHEIENGKLLQGKPLTEKAVQNLKDTLTKISSKKTTNPLKGIVPENIIYLDADTKKPVVVWRTPEMKIKLLFSAETGITSGTAVVPGIIWKFIDESLYVYAYKKYNGLKTLLFHLPLPNINSGSVCLGNVKIKGNYKSFEDLMLSVENYFFNSIFTHKIDDEWTNYWNLKITRKLPGFTGNLKQSTTKTLNNLINETSKR